MDAKKLADLSPIKTTHGHVEVAFCIFFTSKVHYNCIIRISYNVLLYAIFFLEYQCIAGQYLKFDLGKIWAISTAFSKISSDL